MGSTLRRWLISGLLVTLPLAVTLWILEIIVSFLDSSLQLLPSGWRPEAYVGFKVPGVGVLLTLCMVLLIGAFASNYLGAKLFTWWDNFLGRIPIVRSIYSAVKQVSDTLFSSKGNSFREAVLVEYPRKGLWTVAFVTGRPTGELANHLNPDEYLSIYVPTTPNPTSGFYIILPHTDVIPLKISVDEAIKVIVSMGVLPVSDMKEKSQNTELIVAVDEEEQ